MTQAIAKQHSIDPQSLISKALESGANIEVLERLVSLSERVRDASAKEAFQTSFVQFQSECPAIKKNKTARIATRSGSSYGYKYADLDEICRTISPVMQKYGLSWSWSAPRTDSSYAYVSCTIAHVHGHKECSGEVAMPITTGDSGANPAQRVGIAITYARRYSLTGILGIAPEDDTDAHGSEEETKPKGGVFSGAPIGTKATDPEDIELKLAASCLLAVMDAECFTDRDRKGCLNWLGKNPSLDAIKKKLRDKQEWVEAARKEAQAASENPDADSLIPGSSSSQEAF